MKRLRRYIMMLLSMLLLIGCFFNNMVCKAETDFSWLTDGNTGDKNYSKKIEQFQTEIGSIYQLLVAIAFTIVSVMILVVGMKFVIKKVAPDRKELQMKLLVIILVVCAILGMGTIFTIAYSIGSSITTAGTDNKSEYYAEVEVYYEDY